MNALHRLVAVAALLLALVACADPRQIKKQLDDTNDILKRAQALYAQQCAPEELANAESNVAFAYVEFKEGDVRRAGEHVSFAHTNATAALEKSKPCGGVDDDRDKIPNIVDQCPKEPEDYDKVNDEDGCRDVDPNGDEDGDGVKNIDDACLDKAEDFDGDKDEDGCPETSADRDGDSIIDAVDQCRDDPEDIDGFKDSDGCPDPDNDNDNVVDIRDTCPKIAEDRDSWEDEDGCPDPDNDADGIPDGNDQCPNEPGDRLNNGCPSQDKDKDGIADTNDRCPDQPETANQYLDEDGCPDVPPQRVKVTRTMVEIKETIQFATGSATILGASTGVLDDVYQVLVDAPEMRLRIEGHTDNEGSDESNMRLSQERAESVKAYLESRGIDPRRLQAIGYGETRPIDTNRTTAGRAANRRVEFHIVKPQ